MRYIVFCDSTNSIYLEFLSKYPAPGVEIVRVYACGGVFDNSHGFELFSLDTISQKQTFDKSIVFLSETDSIRQLLNMIYGDGTIDSILDRNSFMKECLSGKGQLDLLRRDIALKCPSNHHLILGDFSYCRGINILDVINDGSIKVEIGKFCSLAQNINFMLGADHQAGWSTTYPFNRLLGCDEKDNSNVVSKGSITIGNDVWIGADATVLSGVHIGDGCIVGNHAVVTKDVPPYSVIVGNPGRVVKQRFPKDKQDKLLEIKWWDWDLQMLFDALPLVQSEDIESLYTFWKTHK